MKNFTIIPNEFFEKSQLSIPARYLHLVLIKHSGQKDFCFPSQEYLGKTLNLSSRQIRNILNELIMNGLIKKTRKGYNRSNTYEVAKKVEIDRKLDSPHLRNKFPFQQGSKLPPKSTYVNKQAKRSIQGIEPLRETMKNLNLLKYQQ